MTQTGQSSIDKDVKIRLEIKAHEYKYLAQTIKSHKKTLFLLKINEVLKAELITDMAKIESILSKSETGTVPA
ncbi:MAG: hypothetical protein WC478_01165 [Candidatus Omnitrophota bacterium]